MVFNMIWIIEIVMEALNHVALLHLAVNEDSKCDEYIRKLGFVLGI